MTYGMDSETVTAENIEALREQIGTRDQADELEVGCITWKIMLDNGEIGRMTRWPSGRGAICLGEDSLWGDWEDEAEYILDEANPRPLLRIDGGPWESLVGYDDEGNLVPTADMSGSYRVDDDED